MLLALVVLVRSGGEDEEAMGLGMGGGAAGGKWGDVAGVDLGEGVEPEMDVRFAEVPKAVEEARRVALLEGEGEELVVTAAAVGGGEYGVGAGREVQSVRVADEDPSWRV